MLCSSLSCAARCATFNPDATPAMIDAAVRAVKATPSQDALENNRVFQPWLATGVPVEISRDGETRTIALRLFDRASPKANSFLAANQFIVQGERNIVKADVVAFVNGLPLALMELKSPSDAQATLARAHNQLQTYRAKAPELLRFNQALRPQ